MGSMQHHPHVLNQMNVAHISDVLCKHDLCSWLKNQVFKQLNLTSHALLQKKFSNFTITIPTT